MSEKSSLPPRSPMPGYGLATIAKYNSQVGDLLHRAAGEATILGITAKDPEADVRNHAISVMAELSTTAILATLERLLEHYPGAPIDAAIKIILDDVALRLARVAELANADM